MIKKYKNILPLEEFNTLWELVGNLPWVYGHKTFERGIPFFCQKIESNYVFLEPFNTLCKKIKKLIELDIKETIYPIWIKVNGQVFGQDGSFHQDYQEEGFYTFVFFPMPTWDISWGGEFIVHEKASNNYVYFPPLPNSGIIFPSYFDHMGSGPHRNCPTMRVSIALNFCTDKTLSIINEYDKKIIKL